MSPLWFIVGLTLVLIAVSAVVVVLNGDRVSEFATDSPEHAVQGFVQAILDGDLKTAESLLASENDLGWKGDGCGVVHTDADADARVVLVRTSTSGDEAIVEVAISAVRGFPLFGYGDAAVRDTFRLRRQGASWRITNVPWPFFTCGGLEIGP